ncbi:MAG: hypothetical protein COB15_05505 [Flavobacteriales bacterium]|nr:MAG: hypothetical protein COB15_05505 [Flavobacteriales bacterium]
MIKQIVIACILLSLLIWSNALIAQTDKELEFNVVKPKVEIAITPTYNHLYQNIAHPIKIVVQDSLHTYIFKLAGGTINETDTGTFITPEARGEAILNIYEIRKGNEILVGSKKYLVLPEPLPYLRNKPTDNVLLDMLLVSGTLKGISLYQKKKIVLPVKSFTVVYKGEGNTFKSVNVLGNQIPVLNRKEIAKLSNGALIYFENIQIELMPDFEAQIQPYRVSMEVLESKGVTGFGVGN